MDALRSATGVPAAPDALARVGGLIGCAVLLLAATAFSMALTRLEGGLASVWIAHGLVLGLQVAERGPAPRALFLLAVGANLAVRLWLGDPPGVALGLCAANAIELALLQWGAQRIAAWPGPPRLGRQAARLFVLGVLATAAPSLLAAFVLAGTDLPSFIKDALHWWTAHLLGLVLFGGATLLALLQGRELLGPSGRRLAYVGALAMVAAVTAAVSAQSVYPLLFLTYLPLVLCAYRFGFAGMGLALLLMAAIIGGASLAGLGPFFLVTGLSNNERVLLFQLYVGAGALLAVPVAIAVHQSRQLMAALAGSEARYRLLAEHSQDILVRMGPDARRRYISPSVESMLGWRPDEMVETRWDLVHPEDVDRVRAEMGAVFRDGVRATVAYRIRHRDGHYVDLEARVEPVFDDRGGVAEVVYVSRDVSDRLRAEREAQRLARTDPLTGLPNRRHFEELSEAALRRARRQRRPLALLALDLDRFKPINDAHGHAAGDAVLVAFAQRIVAAVYEVDVVARLGGDEFVVLLEGQAGVDGPRTVAERIIAAMLVPIALPDGPSVVVGTTVGIGFVSEPDTLEDLSALADAALYDAKRAGRGGISVRMR